MLTPVGSPTFRNLSLVLHDQLYFGKRLAFRGDMVVTTALSAPRRARYHRERTTAAPESVSTGLLVIAERRLRWKVRQRPQI